MFAFLLIDCLWNLAWHLDGCNLPIGSLLSLGLTCLAVESLPISLGFSCFAIACPTTESWLITIGLLWGLNIHTGTVVVFAAFTTVGASRQPYPSGRLGYISTNN